MPANSRWDLIRRLRVKVVSLGLHTTKPAVLSPFKACCELHCSDLGKCDFAWIMVILFGFCVTCIKPCLTEYLQKEFWVSFQASWRFWHILTWLCYCSSLSGGGQKFGRSSTYVQITFQMVWSGWIEIPSMSATCDSSVLGTITLLASIFICFPHH